MRFHVVSLPNTQTTRAYSWSPYTEKVRKFCNMMMSLGHEVFLYAGELNEAACTEHIVCISEADRARLFPDRFPAFNPKMLGRRMFLGEATLEVAARAREGDILCLIEGVVQAEVALTLPELTAVEFGVGYSAVFTQYRVWESYAWMHAVMGQDNAALCLPRFIDQVIPNSYEIEDFPLGEGDGDYLVYLGRLDARKGLQVVADIARETGVPLVIAGSGDESLVPEGAEFVGPVDPVARAELLGGARAILAPTLGIEPFGGSVVEAQLCGTPAITTDWGAFTETVKQGETGFRCRDLRQFCKAVEEAGCLPRHLIRSRAVWLYSTENVRHQYEEYFARVAFPVQDDG